MASGEISDLEDQAMDILSISGLIVVVIVVSVFGFYIMKPEKK
jgi:hypothetical protein